MNSNATRSDVTISKRLGCPLSDYLKRKNAGERYCFACKQWKKSQEMNVYARFTECAACANKRVEEWNEAQIREESKNGAKLAQGSSVCYKCSRLMVSDRCKCGWTPKAEVEG